MLSYKKYVFIREPRKNSEMGRKPKITKKMDMQIKRAIANIHQAGEKLSKKLMQTFQSEQHKDTYCVWI